MRDQYIGAQALLSIEGPAARFGSLVMSATQTTVISGGLIATEYGTFQADLVIQGELVSAITTDASDVDANHRIDAAGLLVLPGGIDVHTHFEEPDPNLLEGFVGG